MNYYFGCSFQKGFRRVLPSAQYRGYFFRLKFFGFNEFENLWKIGPGMRYAGMQSRTVGKHLHHGYGYPSLEIITDAGARASRCQ